MSEITTSDRSSRNKGVKKMKKSSTRIDLTPMVDLGFLLITFFIFTTALSQPKVMRLILPDDKGEPTGAKQSGVLTIMPGNNSICYYEGDLNRGGANLQTVALRQIRQVIINKKRNTPPDDMFVIIKPSANAVYGNLVNIVDEMTINDIRHFALTDITAEEEEMIKER